VKEKSFKEIEEEYLFKGLISKDSLNWLFKEFRKMEKKLLKEEKK
jgi:hypothetical protein